MKVAVVSSLLTYLDPLAIGGGDGMEIMEFCFGCPATIRQQRAALSFLAQRQLLHVQGGIVI